MIHNIECSRWRMVCVAIIAIILKRPHIIMRWPQTAQLRETRPQMNKLRRFIDCSEGWNLQSSENQRVNKNHFPNLTSTLFLCSICQLCNLQYDQGIGMVVVLWWMGGFYVFVFRILELRGCHDVGTYIRYTDSHSNCGQKPLLEGN